MPKNSQGQIAVVVPVRDAAVYAFSTADDFAAVSAIPIGGTVLELPSDPNSGDAYGFGDVDGSCSSSHPLTIAAPSGTTIRGGATLGLTTAYSTGRVQFDAASDSWVVVALTSSGGGGGGDVTLVGDVIGSGAVGTNIATNVNFLSPTSVDGYVRLAANKGLGAVGDGSSVDFRTDTTRGLIASGVSGFIGPSITNPGAQLTIGDVAAGDETSFNVALLRVNTLTAFPGVASIDMSASTTGLIQSGSSGFQGPSLDNEIPNAPLNIGFDTFNVVIHEISAIQGWSHGTASPPGTNELYLDNTYVFGSANPGVIDLTNTTAGSYIASGPAGFQCLGTSVVFLDTYGSGPSLPVGTRYPMQIGTYGATEILLGSASHASVTVALGGLQTSSVDAQTTAVLAIGAANASSVRLGAAAIPVVVESVITFPGEIDNGNSGGALTINWNAGQKQAVTLTADCIFTFGAPPGVGNFLLRLVQDGTGGRTVTWPVAVKWQNATAPTLSTGSGDNDIASFYWNGSSYFGSFGANFG